MYDHVRSHIYIYTYMHLQNVVTCCNITTLSKLYCITSHYIGMVWCAQKRARRPPDPASPKTNLRPRLAKAHVVKSGALRVTATGEGMRQVLWVHLRLKCADMCDHSSVKVIQFCSINFNQSSLHIVAFLGPAGHHDYRARPVTDVSVPHTGDGADGAPAQCPNDPKCAKSYHLHANTTQMELMEQT